MPRVRTIKDLIGRAVLLRRLIIGRRSSTALPGMMGLLIALIVTWSSLVSAQIQQAWVAKYNNVITNGNHQALKMTLDSAGNIYVLGVSANANTNTGYVVVKYAPNGNQTWAARYDSTNFPSATPTGFALDGSNNVVVTGNAVTVKYDTKGNLLWTSPYNAAGIVADPGGNTYVTGISGGFTTIKLDSGGSNLWTENGPADLSQAIAIDSFTNIYVAGRQTWYTYKTLTYVRVAALKYNASGSPLWGWNDGEESGPDGGVQVIRLAVDSSGNAYIEGNSAGIIGGYETFKINSDGTSGWENGDPTANGASFASGLVLDSKGNVIVTGQNAHYPPLPSYGTYKLDTNGNYIWANLYPMSSYGGSAALALAIDSVDNIYVTGESSLTNTPYDIATLKLGPNGNQLWLQRYRSPGLGNAAGNGIAVDNSGNVYVAGYETETNGFTSMILIKYSPVTLESQSNGNITLRANGSPGETFDIQASTNLQTWQDLGSIIADTNGIVSFTDINAPLFPARFYYTIPR